MEQIIEEIGKETDDTVREHYSVLIRLVLEKNPRFIEVIRRDRAMEDVLLEIVKDRVDEKISEKEQETLVSSIKSLMTNLKLTVEQAMDALNIPPAQRETYARLIKK